MENWRPVKGFENTHEVSDLGRIRRTTKVKSHEIGDIVKCFPQQKGYLVVRICANGVRMCKALHRLVAETFIPNPLGLPEVNHLGPKSDCSATQLEWRSGTGNMQHAVHTGRRRGKEAGISFNKRLQKWTAKYSPEPNKEVWLGTFVTKREALNVRRAAVASMPHIL